MTKSVYIYFCNRTHLLDLQTKGDKDKDKKEARKAKQDLVAEFVGSNAEN